MIEYTALNFEDLHQVIQAHRPLNEFAWVYRGQAAASWDLVPKAGRPKYHLGKEDSRDLARFYDWRQQAVAYTRELPDNDWEALAVAQHHGLATRLLDWTLNPLAGAYFAASSHTDVDGAVYCFFPEVYVDPAKLPLDFKESRLMLTLN